MLKFTRRWTKRALLALLLFGAGMLALRMYDILRGPPLDPWHTWVAPEMDAAAIDSASWSDYLYHENQLFKAEKTYLADKLKPELKTPLNRYYVDGLVWPEKFTTDWNRSYVLEPPGKPRGAVVLLHGLTDSPYSLRHVAELYRQHGYVAVGIRLPGHGTVPGALTAVTTTDWQAAARLAVREATSLTDLTVPLHLVGYSNGGALAMQYALDALHDNTLRMPERIVLVSPMIGVTSFARFAGLAGLPAVFPAFARSAWLNTQPEFNPFKYNSFPVNAARQSWLLTKKLQKSLAGAADNGDIARLPPVLTFQSVVDATVRTDAVVSAFYQHLPANGSELVLFDINQAAIYRPLLTPDTWTAVSRLLPSAPRRYQTTVITNLSANTPQVHALVTHAGQPGAHAEPLNLRWPSDVYSLSHIALPFPESDSLYGRTPDKRNEFGISIGAISIRGETGVLNAGVESLIRVSSNPFYPWMENKISQVIE